MACALVAAVVVVVDGLVALTLQSSSTGVVAFGPVDQVAIARARARPGCRRALVLGRSRVDADADGRPGPQRRRSRTSCPGRRCAPCASTRKSPWASLLLRNGDELAVFAVQAVDRERAVRAVEGLRALLAAARRTSRRRRRCSTTLSCTARPGNDLAGARAVGWARLPPLHRGARTIQRPSRAADPRGARSHLTPSRRPGPGSREPAPAGRSRRARTRRVRAHPARRAP